MKFKSKALDANIASYHVDVEIDSRYQAIQDVMADLYGLREQLAVFLKELSHPYKNWQFIVNEARIYSLDYIHVLKTHERGPAAARLYVDIFMDALVLGKRPEIKGDAADNLLFFIQKLIPETKTELPGLSWVLDHAFQKAFALEEALFFCFIKGHYPIPRTAKQLLASQADFSPGYENLNRLLIRSYKGAFSYWLGERDPDTWFEGEKLLPEERSHIQSVLAEINHQKIQKCRIRLDEIESGFNIAEMAATKALILLPGYRDILEAYRRISAKLVSGHLDPMRENHFKLLYLFRIMNISGLSSIHEDTLRDINRSLTWIITHQGYWDLEKVIRTTFSILKERHGEYPVTALSCVVNMGRAIFKTVDIDMVNFFIDHVIDLGFEAPMPEGIDKDWSLRINPAHILNVRSWLELIELNPKWSTRLLSALIIHLAASGIYIKDTDLFPRDITRLLNSNIFPVYNLAKQLFRLFPSYFNDIGAEGVLRDISTRIDEIFQRKDPLVHFLRKQSHVESSNFTVYLMESVLRFWLTGEKDPLAPFVPPEVYDAIDSSGIYVTGMNRIFKAIRSEGFEVPDDLFTESMREIAPIIQSVGDASEMDRERAELAVLFYKHLKHKYRLDMGDLNGMLSHLKTWGFPDVQELSEALGQKSADQRLEGLLSYMEKLQGLILSEKRFEIQEDIYKKRHFTVDIPSMYGTYHELKFDALGLTLRLESMVRVLFENLIGEIDLNLITKATFTEILHLLELFNRALCLDGINSGEFRHQLDFLTQAIETTGVTFTQYLDIFKGFARAVRHITNDHYQNIHEQNLNRIVTGLPEDRLLKKYDPKTPFEESERRTDRISEIFFRDRIAQSMGLPQLDIFLTRILNTLFNQANKLPTDKLHLLLNYNPKKALVALTEEKCRNLGVLQLGNKGFNMAVLRQYGMPVPPGTIITTEVFRSLGIVQAYKPAFENFKKQIARRIQWLEKVSSKKYGNRDNPLLLSVRSGSSISQPGMMDTFLDVGLNRKIAEGLGRKTENPWFAWDNYRRLVQGFGMAKGLSRDDFDALIREYKRKTGALLKSQLTGAQMRDLALAYENLVADHGHVFCQDPFDQLLDIIFAVFKSWNSSKAKTYRQIMGISDDWGTAVTLQVMVYGNLSKQSGSGVFFTHNPRWSADHIRLWGDFTLGNQGEDVVSGLVHTLPISIKQQEVEMRETDITLETHFPEIFKTLVQWAHELVDKRGWSPQEMEFTFESPAAGDVYVLQTRDMAMRERKKVLAFDPEQLAVKTYLGHGVAVSGGAMSGRLVFSLEEIEAWRQKEPGIHLILARQDTVPDDIREIFAADGLLTARGGLTSHAAVVAHRLGKTCVVGCENMTCSEDKKECRFNEITLFSGDFISINGREGSVYMGRISIREA